MSQKLTQRMIALRRNHPSWLLLASTNGPVTAACLKTLMEAHPGGVDIDDATEFLAQTFAESSHDPEFEFGDDLALDARRELRKWMKLGIVGGRDAVFCQNSPKTILFRVFIMILLWNSSRVLAEFDRFCERHLMR